MTQSLALWEINSAIARTIADNLNPETGEINPDIIDALEILELSKVEKVINVGLYIKSLDNFTEECSKEIKKIQEKKKRSEMLMEKLKAYLMKNDAGKVNSPNLSISYKKSTAIEVSPELNVDVMAELFPDIIRTKIVREWDKTKIKERIKAGKPIPSGIEQVERTNIIIS